MVFTFFTFGGKQLWEDLFFYQGWRIQRSCLNGKYRLLDAWNIRRESGTLLRCQNAFIHYIEVYQLLRPKQKAVVFLHGLGRTGSMFDSMARAFETEGFTSIAVNFPSLRKSFDDIVSQLEFLLKNLKDIQEVNFVTHGLGGLVLREVLHKNGSWRRKIKTGRIVALDVPNRGWAFGDLLTKKKTAVKIVPALKIYESENIAKLPDFPKNLDVGILTTWNPFIRFLTDILPVSWRSLFPAPKDSHIAGAREISAVKYLRLNQCNAKKVITYCINFIKYGKFQSLQKIKKL